MALKDQKDSPESGGAQWTVAAVALAALGSAAVTLFRRAGERPVDSQALIDPEDAHSVVEPAGPVTILHQAEGEIAPEDQVDIVSHVVIAPGANVAAFTADESEAAAGRIRESGPASHPPAPVVTAGRYGGSVRPGLSEPRGVNDGAFQVSSTLERMRERQAELARLTVEPVQPPRFLWVYAVLAVIIAAGAAWWWQQSLVTDSRTSLSNEVTRLKGALNASLATEERLEARIGRQAAQIQRFQTRGELRAIEPTLQRKLWRWSSYWKKLKPDFSLERFVRMEDSAFDLKPLSFNPYDRQALRRYRFLYAFSPDRRRFIDPNFYLNVQRQGRSTVARPGQDWAVVLMDMASASALQLYSGNKADTFYDAAWISPAKAIVVGDMGDSETRRATIRVINLKSKTSALYVGEPVARERWMKAGGTTGYLRVRYPWLVFR